jgi:hypothetical protein
VAVAPVAAAFAEGAVVVALVGLVAVVEVVGAAWLAELAVPPEVDCAGGVALIEPSALDMMLLLATAPFDAGEARNVAGSGAWIFAIARWTSAFGTAEANPAVPGGGMIIPIPAARRSIRWSSPSEAILA